MKCKQVYQGMKCKQVYQGMKCKQVYLGMKCKQVYQGMKRKHVYQGMKCKHVYLGMKCKQVYQGMKCKQVYLGMKCKQVYQWMKHKQVYQGMKCKQVYQGMKYKADVCNGFDNCNDFSDEQHCNNQSSVAVRLSDGRSEHEGRVEVQYLGEWGIICDDHWDVTEANVICRQLGYHSAIRPSVLSEFGSGNGNFLLDEVNCIGNETSLEECHHEPWPKHDCRTYEAAGVVCKVAKGCHLTEEFQCHQGLCVPLSFVCNGKNDCGDNSDESLCNKTEVRLEGGANATQGRVVLTRNGISGTVCDDRWGDSEARVVCHMMGVTGRAAAVSSAHFGAGSGVIWLDDVACDGSEQDIKDCQHLDWADHNCGHGEDAGVICGLTVHPSPPTTAAAAATPAPTSASGGVCGLRPVTRPVTRIYGGKSAIYGAYPWQASILKRGRFNTYKHSCGGTILNDKWILSAAHCYVNRPKELFRIRVGDSVKSRVESSEQEFAVEELIPHPRYSRLTHNNDIALLKVKPLGGSSIKFSDYVQPACLPDAETVYSPGQRCHISGWGSVGWSWLGHAFPDKLRAAVVPVIPLHVCQQLYKGTLTSSMFCAGYIAGNVDTCQGDSGGPFVCKVNGVYTALGVVSWGQGCAEAYAPGVYTKVQSHRDWLDRTMAGQRDSPRYHPRFFWSWI
ncbi:hypothetical protein LSAT2_002933 [Lamellibrachia satsuma]|nr:hypothetical protein LSAT2_002933 [Lamellibrachia satsuma]